jgi:hypothetical protein
LATKHCCLYFSAEASHTTLLSRVCSERGQFAAVRSYEHLQCRRDSSFRVLADAVLVPRCAGQRKGIACDPLRQALPGLTGQRRPRRWIRRMPRRDLQSRAEVIKMFSHGSYGK